MNAVLGNPTATGADASRWLAQLELEFEQRGTRTVLSHRRHLGPLVVQKPFYPENDTCHVYIVHPPGGVVGGDCLNIKVKLAPDAHALITTPGSGKIYRSAGPTAKIEQQLQVSENSALEWLPQDTILFAGCNVEMVTKIDLKPGATFIGWEIICLGRPSSGETFNQGSCRQRFELWRDGQPLVLERSRLAGSDPLLEATWGLQGFPVTATMTAAPANKEMLAAVRDAVTDCGFNTGFSATLLDDVMVCRYMGAQGIQAREVFGQAWAAIRPLMLNKSACPPRVWAT